MPYKDKAKKGIYDRKWAKKNPDKAFIIQTRYIQKLRSVGIELLGGQCCKCGFSDPRALQFDHINGGGSKERNKLTRLFYGVVIESILKNENKYQLLCANCNWIKRTENNELKR